MILWLSFYYKRITNEFEGEFECLWENTEKYKPFSVPLEKEVTKFNKGGNESVVTISYKMKFIDSARFMSTSLSILLIISQKEFTKLNVRL